MSDRRTGVWLGYVLLLMCTWGSFEVQGASRPDAPEVLDTTSAWSTFGVWPYLARDQAGWHVQWPGMVAAIVATVLGAIVAGRIDRGLQRMSER